MLTREQITYHKHQLDLNRVPLLLPSSYESVWDRFFPHYKQRGVKIYDDPDAHTDILIILKHLCQIGLIVHQNEFHKPQYDKEIVGRNYGGRYHKFHWYDHELKVWTTRINRQHNPKLNRIQW